VYRSALARPEDWGLVRKTLGWGLVLFLLSGVATVPELWAATFYVNATTGDDGRTPATAQDSSTPWRTLTHALANVASGDDVQVASGTYNQALGESYPLALQSGVAIQGAGKATTTLSAPAGEPVFEDIDTPLASGTTLTGFTLTHDGPSMSQSLVHLMPTSVAMAPSIDDNAFVPLDNTEYGIYVDTDAESPAARSYGGTISNNTFDGFYVGLYISADLEAEPGGSYILSPTITGNTFTGNAAAMAISLDDYEGTSFRDTTKIVDNVATGSLEHDVYYYADLETGNATAQPLISGNSFTGAGSDSISMTIETLGAYYPSPSGIDLATGSPTITNNTIGHPSGNGIYVDYSYATSSVVMHPEISGNHVTMPGVDGIYFQIFEEFGADPADVQITIANNSVTDADLDGIHLSGTSLDEYPTFTNGTTTIAGNVIDDPGSTGIIDAFEYDDDAYGTLSRVISGNTVTHGNGSDGIFAYGDSQDSLDAANLEIRDNVVDGGFGHGIHFDYDDWPEGSRVLATCNTVTNNVVGFLVSGSSTSASETADLGGGGSGSPGRNSLFDNTTDLAAQADNVSAQSNWWGTTNVPTILSHIGGAYAGGVNFSNFLSGPPSVTAANDLTASLSGDVITYTATIEGTGNCGCASSTFTAPTPAHTTTVPDSVAVSGATGPSVQGEDPVEVLVGALGAGEMVTVSWSVQIDPGYKGDISEQASFGCTQLAADVASDDPSTPPGGDPTIISNVSVLDVPTLQDAGLATLIVLLLLTGWFMVEDRRRRLLLMLVLGLSLGALGVRAAVRGPAASAQNPVHTAKGGAKTAATHGSRRPEAIARAEQARLARHSIRAATFSRLAVQGKTVRLALADGTTFTVPKGHLQVRPQRLAPGADRGMSRQERRALLRQRIESKRLESLRPGQALVVKARYAPDGSVRGVTLRPAADLAAAEAEVARVQSVRAARRAGAARASGR